MLKFPANMSRKVANALESCLDAPSVEKTLERIAELVLGLFDSKDALAVITEGEKEKANSTFCFVSARTGVSAKFRETLLKKWQDKGVHQAVSADLERRLSPVSYSSFGWPYPNAFDRDDTLHSLPRDYTMLLPMSSRLAVRAESEEPFSGYLALMFDGFPDLSNDVIDLIITLPNVLSAAMLAYFRELSKPEASSIRLFGHDVRHYLSLNKELITQFSDALSKSDSTKMEATLGRMKSSLARMLHQTNARLLAAKESSGSLTINPISVDLNELVERAVSDIEPLYQAGSMTLRIELEKSLSEAVIDPAVFSSVIVNLLDNALKYSAGKGQVVVSTSNSGNAQVRLSVSGNGKSIAKEERERLFDKHFRGSNCESISGDGVGLYLVKKITEAHGGRAYLADWDGPLTTFVVEVPAA